jgi:hypothetical protein
MFLDCSVRSNERGGSNWAFDRFTLSILPRPPCTVGSHDLYLRVRQQDKGQVEFGDELIVGIEAVSADANNHRIRLRCFSDSVAEPARFFGSTRRVIFRIKPKHDVFTGIVG